MSPDATPPAQELRHLLQINQLCDEFEAEYRAGHAPRLESYLARAPALPAVLEHLLPIELAYRQRRGERPTPDEYTKRFPALDREVIARLFPGAGEPAFPPTLGEYDLVRRIGSG